MKLMKQKILLALGFRQLEEYLKKHLKKEYEFVGETVYREGIIRAIGQKNPDIVVIRETLHGRENILSIIYEIRVKFPKVRIIFIAGKREVGDALLATLVSYGVYDILYGQKVNAQDVISLIRKPNEYSDVQHLQPKPVLDETKNQILYEAPDIITKEVVKEVVREVYIENDMPRNKEKIEKKELLSEEKTIAPSTVLSNSNEKSEEKEDISPQVETPNLQERTALNEEKEKTHSAEAKESEQKDNKEKSSFLKKIVFPAKEKEREQYKEISATSKETPKSPYTGKQKIITFIGAKSGVGNTSIALNTAVHLARKKNKVLYMELNDRCPSVSYWYELGYIEDGIDKALKGIEKNHLEYIHEAIIQASDLKRKESSLRSNYQKFPDTLDFMFFSNQYLTRRPEDPYEIKESLIKDLYLYLLFQLEYDYLVLDVPSDIWRESTLHALRYANRIFMTVTQDVSVIGNAVYMLNELIKKHVQLDKKLHFIINKYEKGELKHKEIEEWLEIQHSILIPCLNREFIHANFVGLPILLATRSSSIKNAFQEIERIIA